MLRLGFDNEKYLQMQSKRIKERISQFGGKLYLEFGGKLLMITMHRVFCPALNRTAKSICWCS